MAFVFSSSIEISWKSLFLHYWMGEVNEQRSYININNQLTIQIHVRATRVVIHSIVVLGPSALDKGENYLWQWKFKEPTLD